jgi:hypothetical protein
LTIIEDIKGNIFGGFTPVQWESRIWNMETGSHNNCHKSDDSLRSFIFTLKNPHDISPRKFALAPGMKEYAIYCDATCGPLFGGNGHALACDIRVWNHQSQEGNMSMDSYAQPFGVTYLNDTGMDGRTLFTGAKTLLVKEIEVFEIIESGGLDFSRLSPDSGTPLTIGAVIGAVLGEISTMATNCARLVSDMHLKAGAVCPASEFNTFRTEVQTTVRKLMIEIRSHCNAISQLKADQEHRAASLLALEEGSGKVSQVESNVAKLSSLLQEMAISLESTQRDFLTSIDTLRRDIESLARDFRSIKPGTASPPKSNLPSQPRSLFPDSLPDIFERFNGQQAVLLWRGSRDGFGAHDFHNRCDGRRNTLTIIRDIAGNIFGGFTPVAWESRSSPPYDVEDPTVTSFLFTLKNALKAKPMAFPLRENKRHEAIFCRVGCGPRFGLDTIVVCDQCNSGRNNSVNQARHTYVTSDAIFFTGSRNFQVAEIEIFEMRD